MNVLFLVVDDLRPQLNCYGVEWIHSPNIDALAAEGVLFERAYCQQAVCGPSRASVLSGCRPDTTGVHDLQTMLSRSRPDLVSLPRHFREHGYETVSIGKVYHHVKDDAQAWSKPPIINTGDWQGRGYLTDEAIEDLKRHAQTLTARGQPDRAMQVGPAFEAADVPDDAYHDGKDALSAMAELRRLKDSDRPFFMALGFHKPHLPFNAPKRYWDLYDAQALPLAANPFEPENVTPHSLTNYGELRQYFGIPGTGDIPDPLARKLIHGYAACVSYTDAQIGRVLAELKRLGLDRNTLVMLWGDHGWKLGEHNSWSKHTNFEIDTHAPLIVRMPDAATAGARCSALVEFVDMYPTLCQACQLPVPAQCEGTSLLPLLAEPTRPWKSAAFSQYPRDANIMGYAVRTDRYRYIEWRDRTSSQVLARELYDHHADPQENVNLAAAMPDEAQVRAAQRLAEVFGRGGQAIHEQVR